MSTFETEGIRTGVKMGRCANGAESDAGCIVHAIQRGTALCGTVPGRYSVGWHVHNEFQLITCGRCLQRLTAAMNPKYHGDRLRELEEWQALALENMRATVEYLEIDGCPFQENCECLECEARRLIRRAEQWAIKKEEPCEKQSNG